MEVSFTVAAVSSLRCDLVLTQQGGERGGMKDELPNGQTLLFYVPRTYIEL